MKSFTLQFFDVSYSGLTSSSSLVNRISSKLSSPASGRMMPINKSASDTYDLISNSSIIANKTAVAGTCFRVKNSKDVPVINVEVLNQPSFSISAINKNAKSDERACFDFFYFCLSDKYLIVASESRFRIARLETYINWLLNTMESKEVIIFNPIFDETKLSLSDIKKITIGNTFNLPIQDSTDLDVKSRVVSITNDILDSILSEAPRLKDLMEAKICSADLVIKFSKPRGMSKDEYVRKTAGAILKPLDDPDGIKFASNGKKVSGSQVLKEEVIEVDCDENGNPSEQNIYLDLYKRIIQLK